MGTSATMTKTHEQKITFGEMRSSGVREILVYCRDHKCSHSTTMSADRRAEVSGTVPCRCEAAI